MKTNRFSASRLVIVSVLALALQGMSLSAASTNAAIAAVQAESTSLLDQIKQSITQLTSQATSSTSSAASTSGGFAEQLQKLSGSIQSGNDAEASGLLQQLMAAKPTDSQLGLLTEVRNDFALLSLGRNFDTANAATQSSVGSAITAIQSGDTTQIVSSLQSLYSKAQLNDAQKQLVGGLVSSWNPKLAETANKAGKLLNTAKSFGF